MNIAFVDGWFVDKDWFVFMVAIFVAFGIVKDIFMFGSWFDKKMQNNKKRPDGPLTNERFVEGISESAAGIVSELKALESVRLDSILRESQKTNDLLLKFLVAQKVIAKSQWGLDLDI